MWHLNVLSSTGHFILILYKINLVGEESGISSRKGINFIEKVRE